MTRPSMHAGMYARACARSSGKTPADEETQREVTALRSALAGKLAEVQAVVASEETSLSRANMWLGKDETEAVVLALGPKLEKTAKELERLIGEVVTLEVWRPFHALISSSSYLRAC